MLFYISDLHFGHRNVIRYDKRPFMDRDEMDWELIRRWNERVQSEDEVYIIGDFCYRSDKSPEWFLKQLQGRKHLIIGNHDEVLLSNPRAMAYFEKVDVIKSISDGERRVWLSHFPLAEWSGMHKGYWHIYGHIHARKEAAYNYMKEQERALNAGCMINGYAPVTFEELIKNNKNFQICDEKEVGSAGKS